MSKDPRDKIRNPDCELCPLHKGAEHVCLMGDGPIPSKVMVIGEAPGKREDAEHRAFVGPAGQLLDEVLQEAGLERDTVYITNVARCRPPQNRTPKRGEIKTCVNEYLWEEVAAVRPDYILTLGNAALQGVLGKSGIKKHRGTVVEIEVDNHPTTVLATYHPAFVLRSPYFGIELRADVTRFAKMVRGATDDDPKTKTVLINTTAKLRSLRRVLLGAGVISFDLETQGLDEWRSGHIVSIGFTWKPGFSAVVPLWHSSSPWRDPAKVLRFLKPALERTGCKYIAHNGKFDCRWLAKYGIFVPLTFDTMLAAHMIDENRSKGLKPLSQVILGAHAYDIGEDVKDAYNVPIRRLAIYNGKDTDYTYRLYHKFKQDLKAEQRHARVFAKLMMPASNSLTKVERIGIWSNEKRIKKQLKAAEKKLYNIHTRLMEYTSQDSINFNSPQQVARWLFEELDLNVIERTENDHPSTREGVLLHLAKDHPAPKLLLEHRLWAKRLSTYLRPWYFEHRDEKSRMHPTYKLFGTVTGRLSCENPNLQQVPRESIMRTVFGAPPGYTFIQADYAQIELRIAAHIAQEDRLRRLFLQGKDPHMDTAVDLVEKHPSDVTKEERKKAKSVNFGFLFSMGWAHFIDYAFENYGLEISPHEAQVYRDKFFTRWPKLRSWHNRQRRLVHRYGRVQSPIGRVRHLPHVSSSDKGVRAEAERQAINSPVQSMASDLMLLSLVRLDNLLPRRGAYIVGTVHDALLFQVRDRLVDSTCRLIKETMEDPPIKRLFDCELSVPIVADIEVGKYWGDPNMEAWNG